MTITTPVATTKGVDMHQPSYSYNNIQQEKLAQTLNNALAAHKRIMAVRVDCRYPDRSGDAWPLGQIVAHSDSDISRFIASLKAKLDADLASKQKAWGRNLRNPNKIAVGNKAIKSKITIRYIAQSSVDGSHLVPCFKA